MTMNEKGIDPVRHVLIMLALFVSLALFVPGICSIISFYYFTDDFFVSDVHMVCEKPLNNRCVRHYSIIDRNGSLRDYRPNWATFGAGGLRAGVHFIKPRYGFIYSINRVSMRWVLLSAEALRTLVGALGLVTWVFFGGIRYLTAYSHLLASKLRWEKQK